MLNKFFIGFTKYIFYERVFNLLRVFIILLSCLFYQNYAKADNLTIITNGSITGTNGQQSKIFSDFLILNNYKTETKITNQNCALAKLLWEFNNDKKIMLISHGIDGLTEPNNKACFLDIKNNEIIFWIYTTPYYFCSTGRKTWNDFSTPNTSNIVAIHPENKSVELFEHFSRKFKNTIKVVKVNTSSIVLTMAKAEEIDFAFRSGIFDLEAFKDRCIWSSIKANNLTTLPEIAPELNSKATSFSVNGYFIARNLDQKDLSKIIPILKQAWNSSDMLQIHKRRGYDNLLVDFNNEQEYKNRLIQLIEILKND